MDSSWQVRRPAAAESVRSEASPDGAAKPSGATLGAFPTRSGGDVAGVRRFAALRLQAKLSVGGTDDPAEREADAVAAEVTSRIRQGIALESQEVRRTPAQRIQRRSTDGGAGGRVDADTEQRIRARRGSGAPLPDDVARQMESGFGSDFSHVRLHTGAEPAELNRRLQARAFTVGSDVFMGEGSDLRSPAGQELLAHELTHVVQQGDTTVRRDEEDDAAPWENALAEAVQSLFDAEDKPGEEQFSAMLMNFAQQHAADAPDVLNQPGFAWALMKAVGESSGANLHEAIRDATGTKPKIQAKFSPAFKAKWTIRHYTKAASADANPAYTTIRNTNDLLASGILDKSANTTDKDWNTIGNTGFGFFLLSIDGAVPKRTFLEDCTHYAEFDFDTLPDVFASGDMLGHADDGEVKGAFKGPGAEVKAALCNAMPPQSPTEFLDHLDSKFTNFEIKVPGKLEVTRWIPK